MIATVVDDAAVMCFVNSVDAQRLADHGTSCPDHFLRTKIKPLYVPLPADGVPPISLVIERLAAGLEQYRRDYAAYYEACRRPDSPPMRDPSPTVVLLPGLGLVAWAKTRASPG